VDSADRPERWGVRDGDERAPAPAALTTPETGDLFGQAVEIGDLSGGGGTAGPDDLAVGVPGEDVGSAVDAGAVVVLVSPTLHQLLLQTGVSESGDRFAAALSA
jgi:hypothetical protein